MKTFQNNAHYIELLYANYKACFCTGQECFLKSRIVQNLFGGRLYPLVKTLNSSFVLNFFRKFVNVANVFKLLGLLDFTF